MKEKKSGLAAIIFAFLGLLATWLIQENFVQLVSLWKEAKAKINGSAENDQSQQQATSQTQNASSE